MNNLPTEIVWKIAQELDFRDVEAWATSCHQCCAQLNDDFWKTQIGGHKTEATWRETLKRRELLWTLQNKYIDTTIWLNEKTPLVELKRMEHLLWRQQFNKKNEQLAQNFTALIIQAFELCLK